MKNNSNYIFNFLQKENTDFNLDFLNDYNDGLCVDEYQRESLDILFRLDSIKEFLNCLILPTNQFSITINKDMVLEVKRMGKQANIICENDEMYPYKVLIKQPNSEYKSFYARDEKDIFLILTLTIFK